MSHRTSKATVGRSPRLAYLSLVDDLATSPVLEVRALTVTVGMFTVVDRLDFSLERGRIVALAGPSGSGKTTALRALTGLTPIASGSVRLGGRDMTGQTADALASSGVASLFFGNAGLADELTVEPSLDAPPAVGASAVSGVTRLRLARSRGARRWIEVTHAAAARPDVLVLDAPGAGLCAAEEHSIACSLRALADDGMAIVVTERDPQLAAAIADDVIHLDHGVIVDPSEQRHPLATTGGSHA